MPVTYEEDLKIFLDPAGLGPLAGMQLDDWQADVLRCRDPQIILNIHRQAGKSTTIAVKALWTALYEPKALVLLLSPSLRQSRELFRKVVDTYDALGRPVKPVVDNTLELELINGGRIVSLPGTEATIRGFSAPRLVIMDEASKIPTALYTAVRPMLAISRGSLALLSTPYGKRGFFHDEWTKGGPNWKRVLRTADQCPRITPEWLAEEQRHMEDFLFRQEYCGEFGDIAGQFFREADILDAFRTGDLSNEDGDPFHSCDGLLETAPAEIQGWPGDRSEPEESDNGWADGWNGR
jgi:hypothetical protein